MVHKVIILSGLLVCLWAVETWAQAVGANLPRVSAPRLILAPVAGIPYVEAVAIVDRQRPQLMALPGVENVVLTRKGLTIYTDQPDGVPGDVEGLPVTILPLAAQGTPVPDEEGVTDFVPYPNPDLPPLKLPPEREAFPVAGMPAAQAEAILERHKPELLARSGVSFVGLEPEGLYVQVHREGAEKTLPTTIEGLPVRIKFLPTLPPPPGVIVLRPGGVRESADACPPDFRETQRFDWRFCVDPQKPETIPAIMTPPIAGIPFEEALAILERHQLRLMQLPGVQSVGLGSEGIEVESGDPSLIPDSLEGLPVKALPPSGPYIGATEE